MRAYLAAGGAAAALLMAGPGFAQIAPLPETSRAEAQSNALNNSLTTQSQNRSAVQQNQFETNSLRSQSSVQPVTPSYTGPSVIPQRR